MEARRCELSGNDKGEAMRRWWQRKSRGEMSTDSLSLRDLHDGCLQWVCWGFLVGLHGSRWGGMAWAHGGSRVWVAGWLSLSTNHCHNPVFFRFFFSICQICLIRCCRWVCEVALGGGGGIWSIPMVKGGCDYCFFIANKSNNNNNN